MGPPAKASKEFVDAVRVRNARPRELGVHAAVQVDGETGDQHPTLWVPNILSTQLRRLGEVI
jgi:hypothetical protein